jgi:hypothetical protein
MGASNSYDVTYVTIDSLSEGVGSSQIRPLITRLSNAGLKVRLVSFEKSEPSQDLQNQFGLLKVDWSFLPFDKGGTLGGIYRMSKLKRLLSKTSLIHARSDIPAVAGILSREAPVLWDVRSLWADQKILIQNNSLNRNLYYAYRSLESISSHGSLGMSTLTSAVVPVLEKRHKKLPKYRSVVPTTVDLGIFKLTSDLPTMPLALFSGTYNQYYDLELSRNFMDALRRLVPVETHWARPHETPRALLNVGETRIFPSSQLHMASIIPLYSFGVSICRNDVGVSLSAAVPTKIGEFLACGRPVVINKGLGDMDRFIKEYKIGVIVDGNLANLKEQANELVDLLSDPETPQRCRNFAKLFFNMDIGADNYLGLYARMLGSKTRVP